MAAKHRTRVPVVSSLHLELENDDLNLIETQSLLRTHLSHLVTKGRSNLPKPLLMSVWCWFAFGEYYDSLAAAILIVHAPRIYQNRAKEQFESCFFTNRVCFRMSNTTKHLLRKT